MNSMVIKNLTHSPHLRERLVEEYQVSHTSLREERHGTTAVGVNVCNDTSEVVN